MISETSARIKLARKSKGLSQDALAKILEVTGGAVSRWEKGSKPERERMPTLAEALDVDQAWLDGYGDREPIKKVNPGNGPGSALLASSMADWQTIVMVARLLDDCLQASALSDAQRGEVMKRLYVLALRDHLRLTHEAVVNTVLSQV